MTGFGLSARCAWYRTPSGGYRLEDEWHRLVSLEPHGPGLNDALAATARPNLARMTMPPSGSDREVKTDYDVVCSFLGFESASSGRLQAEVRRGRGTTDPRSGQPVEGMPTAVLWCGDQPVAALIGGVVLVNRGSREANQRRLVAEEAARRGREVQHVREPDLWRLAA